MGAPNYRTDLSGYSGPKFTTLLENVEKKKKKNKKNTGVPCSNAAIRETR